MIINYCIYQVKYGFYTFCVKLIVPPHFLAPGNFSSRVVFLYAASRWSTLASSNDAIPKADCIAVTPIGDN